MGRIVKTPSVATSRYVVVVPAVGRGEAAPYERHVPMPPMFEDEAPTGELEQYSADLGATEHEARSIVEAAETDAHTILVEARERAASIIETARQSAEHIEQGSRGEGYAAGSEEGRSAGRAEFDEALATLEEMIDSLRRERTRYVEAAEPELVRLAMTIAERILHQQIALDKSVVVEMARAALSRLLDRESVTIRVNPHDFETMREHREAVLALGEVKQMRIIEDQRVDRGGVVVETDAGSVDAKVSTQIREARRVLHIDDDVLLTPVSKDDEPKGASEAPQA
jgi:flagellar assembly protein FliH